MHFSVIPFLNLEVDVCFSSAHVWLAADPSVRPYDFSLIASANKPANLLFPGDDLAEDATRKAMLAAKVAKEKKNNRVDDVLKCLECSSERLQGPSGLFSVLTNKFSGQ